MSKEAKNAVYNIVAFVFADPKKAKAVHDELKASKSEAKEQGYKIVANAVVEVDEKGKALAPFMPRWSMSTQDLTDLVSYLQTLK